MYLYIYCPETFQEHRGSSSFAKTGYSEESNFINASNMEKAVLWAQILNTENLQRREMLQMSQLGKGTPGKDSAPY